MLHNDAAALDARQFQVTEKKTPELNDMRSCFVIDGLPRVVASKLSVLLQASCNFIKKHGIVIKAFEMPSDPETGGSCGFMFVECASKTDSEKILMLQDARFDTLHRLKINAWCDFNENLSPLTRNTYDTITSGISDMPCPFSFLEDKTGREQVLIKSGSSYDVQIFWHDPHMNVKQMPITVPAGSRNDSSDEVVVAPREWTELDRIRKRVQKDFPKWSPLGSYVMSLEESSGSIWYTHGNTWSCMLRLDHPKMQGFEMGPVENHAITWCSSKCIIWNLALCKMLKAFPLRGEGIEGHALKWSFDESFLAYSRHDKLVVYELRTMEKAALPNIEKDSKITFSWSPDTSLIFYSVEPTQVEKPVRIYALAVGQGLVLTEKSTRSVYSVAKIQMIWQKKATKSDCIYCAIVMRSSSSQRKDKIDLYRCGGKEIGIEQIEVSGNFVALEWDPSGLFGSRFCIMSEARKAKRSGAYKFEFYHVQLGNIRLIKSIDDQQSSALFWSPKGTHAVAKTDSGTLEFYRIDSDNVAQLLLQEHYNCSKATWDPSGRYFVTSIPVHETEIDTGYRIYNFLGQLLFHAEKEKFAHVLWRPQPHDFISIKDQQEILKTLEKRIKAYEEEEENRRRIDQSNADRMRDEEISRHKKIISSIMNHYAVDTTERIRLRAQLTTVDGLDIFDEVPRIKETILDVKESYYQSTTR